MNSTTPVLDERKDRTKRTSFSFHENIRLLEESIISENRSIQPDEQSSPLLKLNKGSMCRGGMIGQSPQMMSIFSLIKKVAKTNTSVLLTGESGTGKELVARAVHNEGRSTKSSHTKGSYPFVAVNCGALPAGLMESELFGHEKGAFTGASSQKNGIVETAAGGTLFLDEIATLPLHLQVKLLRFLQERTFTRVGGNRNIRVELRVIAATNVNLREAVKKGEFREDLFYRLNVVPVEIPPLRERKDDIPPLITHFFKKYSSKYSRSLSAISAEAVTALRLYGWPGNVRELENIIERIVVLAPDDRPITKTDLPVEILASLPRVSQKLMTEASKDFKAAVRNFERDYITSLLEKTGWNRARTARLMKVHRNTLLIKMRTLKIGSC